jgi:hypothetical protein
MARHLMKRNLPTEIKAKAKRTYAGTSKYGKITATVY